MSHIMTQTGPQAGNVRLLTAAEVRADLERRGKTIRAVARELGVTDRAVYDLLRGRFKGRRGEAHKAAVLLGMKDGVIE